MNTFQLTLDLSKRGVIQTVQIRQGDQNGTTIVATITDHGVAASTSGLTARFQMKLPDGTHYYRKAATLSGNVATVTLDEAQAASVVGRTDTAYFQLLQGGTVVASTESFTVIVLPDALADATVPESYDSAIQDAIDALDEAVEQMPSTVENVLAAHPEWTTTVQDGSITEAKLATDLARDRERLMYRLANLLTNALPEGDVATASDAAQTPVAGLALYGRSTQDGTPTPSSPVPIVSVEGNLYQQTMFAAGTTRTTGGVEVTYNEDGTCTVTGTATSNAWLWGSSSSSDARLYVTLPAGTYTICGSHSVIAQKMVGSTVSNIVSQAVRQATFTLTEGTLVKAVPVIPSGMTVSGETAWVALYRGSTAYPYVPYGNAGLWARGRNLWSLGQEYSRTSAGDLFARSAMHVPAGQYTLSFDVVSFTSGSNNNAQLLMYDQSVTVVTQPSVALRTGRVSVTVNPSRDVESLKLYVGTACTLANFQLERGTTATAYHPYEQTVTPIDLDGHALRSLPDGTRDELDVDERGHAVLVQRVGHGVFDGSSDEMWSATSNSTSWSILAANIGVEAQSGMNLRCDRLTPNVSALASMPAWSTKIIDAWYCKTDGITTLADWRTWLSANPLTLDYPLATPVTHDLGYVAAVPLVGPDLTAQAIPTAPMQLTYERDLNATLARLESAIATLA